MEATLKQVQEFFGMTSGEFRKEWMALPTEAKEQIRKGIGDGTLTY